MDGLAGDLRGIHNITSVHNRDTHGWIASQPATIGPHDSAWDLRDKAALKGNRWESRSEEEISVCPADLAYGLKTGGHDTALQRGLSIPSGGVCARTSVEPMKIVGQSEAGRIWCVVYRVALSPTRLFEPSSYAGSDINCTCWMPASSLSNLKWGI